MSNAAEDTKRAKTLIADLPMMYPSDYRRFEKEGGVWGKQFAQRRRQLTFAGVVAALNTVIGSAYVLSRRNTLFVLFSTFSGFTVLGFCVGMSLAPLWFENIANNKETSMMRRVWWAKECAKHWDYSQVDGERWKAAYPHSPVPGSIE